MTLEIRLILVAVLVLLGSAGVLYWNFHERGKGAAVCEHKDLDEAKAQLAQDAKDLAAYRKQLETANEQHQKDQELLAAAAATPAVRLVCHTASAKPMPAVPAASGSQPAGAGAADQVHSVDFDPLPDLIRLSVGYEQSVEDDCRVPLSQWPKPPPGS